MLDSTHGSGLPDAHRKDGGPGGDFGASAPKGEMGVEPLAVVYVGNVEQLVDSNIGRAVKETLMVVEATLPQEKEEAIKDLVRQALWRCAKSIKNEVERMSFPLRSEMNHG